MLNRVFAVGVLMLCASYAAAEGCEFVIEANDMMQFNQAQMAVSKAECESVTVKLKHTGKLPATSMGHNWVLTTTANKDAVTSAGLSAGAAKNYLPENDARVLAATKIIGGGQETAVTFSLKALKAGDDYSFFCSFPGHSFLMKGKFIVSA